jgi:hypothetical protein
MVLKFNHIDFVNLKCKKYLSATFWNYISTPINFTITLLTALSAGQTGTQSQFLSTTQLFYILFVSFILSTANTFFNLKEMNDQKVFWSRGNGWALAGLARILSILDSNDTSRYKFEKQFIEMANRIKKLQLSNGGWSSSLLNPQDYIESSGTSFFCYSIAWGINNKLLDSYQFLNVALNAYNALINNCIDKNGRLNHVQPVGKSPEIFDNSSSEPFGIYYHYY